MMLSPPKDHPKQDRLTPSGGRARDITQLLVDWSQGDRTALDQLMPLVYEELRRLAHQHLRRERPGHTLSTTALVHETYLRLIDQRQVDWQNRAQFFALAAQLMRRILVNYARDHRTQKRGGSEQKLSLDEDLPLSATRGVDLVALDDALTSLAARDAQKSRIVELRFFGGLTVEETAAVIGVSPRTVKREWRLAKAWLYLELSQSGNVG
jgi:RNA polymerase sigma factor (TIGR02999 family)